MKTLLSLALTALLGGSAWGQTIDTNAPTPTPTNAAPSPDLARYAGLVRTECEYGTQAQLYSDLAQEHLLKAQDAHSQAKAEIENWETELGRQFIERGSAAKSRYEHARRDKEAMQQQFPNLNDSLFAGAAATVVGDVPLHPDEVAYVDRVDQRIRAIQAELAVLNAESVSYAERLPTNDVAADVYRLSAALEQNRQLTRELAKEQADLELRILEFRALRRSTARQNGTR
jgi:hypothetical protein